MKKAPEVVDLRGFLSFQILHELRKGKKCGDELADIIGKRKKTKLTPGTIYPTLKKLKRYKLIRKTKRDGRKKHYELTERGQEEHKLTKKIVKNMFRGL